MGSLHRRWEPISLGFPLNEEFLTIAKRKPPSRRPERQLDETARAIARSREITGADKSPETPRTGGNDPQSMTGRTARSKGHLKSSGPVVSPSTKRPKAPGS